MDKQRPDFNNTSSLLVPKKTVGSPFFKNNEERRIANKIKKRLQFQLIQILKQKIEHKQKQYFESQQLEKIAESNKLQSSWQTQITEFSIHLFPVCFIAIIASKIMPALGQIQIKSTSLVFIMLQIALCIPWMSQMASLPMYSGIGHELYLLKNEKVEKIILQYFPGILIISSFIEAFFISIYGLVTNLNGEVVLLMIANCILHTSFSLLMTYGSVSKKWAAWMCSWFIYGTLLLLYPTKILYPPFFSSIFMLIYLLKRNGKMFKPKFEKKLYYLFLIGMMMGLVLWIDKILAFNFHYFYVDRNALSDFSNWMIFIPLIPSIISFNLYYVFFSPQVDEELKNVVISMDKESIYDFINRKNSLARLIQLVWIKTISIIYLLSVVTAFLYSYFNHIEMNKILGLFLLSATLSSITIILNSFLLLRLKRTIFLVTILVVLFNLSLLSLSVFGNFNIIKTYNGLSMVAGVVMMAMLFVLILFGIKKWNNLHLPVLRGE